MHGTKSKILETFVGIFHKNVFQLDSRFPDNQTLEKSNELSEWTKTMIMFENKFGVSSTESVNNSRRLSHLLEMFTSSWIIT